MSRALRSPALGLAAVLLLAGCGLGADQPAARETSAASTAPDPHGDAGAHESHPDHVTASPAAATPLRPSERRVRLEMPVAYTPSAPYGAGTDDYRCFVLDPGLSEDAFITGLDIAPGDPEVVHHVILFRAPPEAVEAVEAVDAGDPGEGWTCFGDSGVRTGGSPVGGLEDAPWLGAWAPGGSEQVLADGVGVPLRRGSRVIMQVHYNLLAGTAPDRTSARLRLTPASEDLAALRTMLLPAPVELPCRPGRGTPARCDRETSVEDGQRRFGAQAGLAADYLHLLCGPVRPAPVQRCDRRLRAPATVRAAAGHMHLLGRTLRIEANPGTPRARTLLDVEAWNFDDQGATEVDPVTLRRGDTVRVTCRHDQRLRDLLPSFEGQPERYVVWGEGTTDEMCLGLLLVTDPPR